MDVTSGLRNFALGRLAAEQASSRSAVARPEQSKQGAMILIDNFVSSSSHGYSVEGAARSLGPTGSTFQVNQHESVNGRLSMPHARAVKELQAQFVSGPLSVEAAAQQLESFIVSAAQGNVELATAHLAAVEGESFRNSVVNLSQGIDAIGLMNMVSLALSPSSKLTADQQTSYRQNLERALSLEGDSTQTSDEKLLHRIRDVLHTSPAIKNAIEGWRIGVQRFEAANNSVVVAAGNSGKAYKGLERAGFQLDGSEDANLLAVPEVTTVGATSVSAQGIVLDASSSFGEEVDFLAPGDHGASFGTSYASPKVANALRAAHILHPEFSSDQAQQWVGENLGQTVTLGEHQVALLSPERSGYLLNALEQKRNHREG